MCDCYWPKCAKCDEHVPLHIADFCMPRSDVVVFCPRHLPRKNVVIYELIAESYRPGPKADDDAFYGDPPKGWRMGVRYRRPPPRDHDLQAAEPNIGARPYLATCLTRRGQGSFLAHESPRRHRTERAAIRSALDAIGAHRKRFAKEAGSLHWLEEEERLWAALNAQSRIRARLPRLLNRIPLVRQLRESGDLQALVLMGSLNNRDFVPGLSDLDLWVLGRRLKPGLKVDTVKVDGQPLEVNLVCRNGRFLRHMLRERTSVDLVALRHGSVLFGRDVLRAEQRRVRRYRASRKTRNAWMKSSARWLGRALEQYFTPDCAHCFFGAIFHASRDMLRAHLVGAGEDLTEGWETEAALARRWPDLAGKYGRLRHARANWESFEFPLFKDRTNLTGDLGELVQALWDIARTVYRGADLKLPALDRLLAEVSRRRSKGAMFWTIQPDAGQLAVGFHGSNGKLQSLKRRIGPGAANRGRTWRSNEK